MALPPLLTQHVTNSNKFAQVLSYLGSSVVPIYNFPRGSPELSLWNWKNRLIAKAKEGVDELQRSYSSSLTGLDRLGRHSMRSGSGVPTIAWFSFGHFLKDVLMQMHDEHIKRTSSSIVTSQAARPMQLQDLFAYLIEDPHTLNAQGRQTKLQRMPEDVLNDEMDRLIEAIKDPNARAIALLATFGDRVIGFAIKNHFLPHARALIEKANVLEPCLLPIALAFSDSTEWYLHVAECTGYFNSRELADTHFLAGLTQACKASIARKGSGALNLSPKVLHDQAVQYAERIQATLSIRYSLAHSAREPVSARKQAIYGLTSA